jgi:hypothetical protein
VTVKGACVGCGKAAKYSVQLAIGPDGDGDEARYYIPNDFARESPMGNLQEVPFCPTCMRSIEDNLRATVRYLQHESGVTPLSIYEYGFIRGKAT